MDHRPERRIYLKLAALAAGLAPFLWGAAKAQEIPLDTGPSSGAVANEVAALRAELDVLKRTVKRLDDEASTIRAPFTVHDDDREIFGIAMSEEGHPRLRLTDAGGASISMGFQDGGGAFVIRDAGGTMRAQVIATPDNAQLVVVDTHAHVVVGTAADGSQSGFFLDRDGKRAAELFATTSSGELWLMDGPDKLRAKLSGDGEVPLTFYDEAGETIVAFEIDDGGAQLMLGKADGAGLRAGMATGGDGSFMSLRDKGNAERIVLSAQSEGQPVTLSDPQAKEYFTIRQLDGQPLLTLGDADKASVIAGITSGAAGGYLALFDDGSRDRVTLSADQTQMAIAVIDDQAKNVFSVQKDEARTQLTLGDPEAAHVQTGTLQGGSGTYLSLYDSGNTERCFVTAEESSTRMQMSDQAMTLDLGRDALSDKTGLFLSKDNLNFASIAFNESRGGLIRLGNETGAHLVAIGQITADGGGVLALNGPGGGGEIVATLLGTADGGALRLDDGATGKPRVQITASTSGDVNLYGDNGSLTATSGTTAPVLQLADAGGTVLVEAFINGNGLGVVQAGPAGNGVAGTIGGGMQAASAILGKK